MYHINLFQEFQEKQNRFVGVTKFFETDIITIKKHAYCKTPKITTESAEK